MTGDWQNMRGRKGFKKFFCWCVIDSRNFNLFKGLGKRGLEDFWWLIRIILDTGNTMLCMKLFKKLVELSIVTIEIFKGGINIKFRFLWGNGKKNTLKV